MGRVQKLTSASDSKHGGLSDSYLEYFTFPGPWAFESFLPRVPSVPTDSKDEACKVEYAVCRFLSGVPFHSAVELFLAGIHLSICGRLAGNDLSVH